MCIYTSVKPICVVTNTANEWARQAKHSAGCTLGARLIYRAKSRAMHTVQFGEFCDQSSTIIICLYFNKSKESIY